MALQGKFIVNNADYSPLTIFGVGTFLAFSGNGVYRNRGGCTMMPDNGPLPAGRYWIVDRPEPGLLRRMYVKAQEIPTWLTDRPIIASGSHYFVTMDV